MKKHEKFPHTPHLAWLAAGRPRTDKVLSPVEAADLLNGFIQVEEKIDGANLGISFDEEGRCVVMNRGTILGPGSHAQFQPLWPWIAAHQTTLSGLLGNRLTLFGEWCFAVHSMRYDSLPDWFLAFDVFDHGAGKFWSSGRRDGMIQKAGLSVVPRLGAGRFSLEDLVVLVKSERSRVGSNFLEGLYVRDENEDWLIRRAKLVRPEFTQSIEEHWSSRPIEKNRLAAAKC